MLDGYRAQLDSIKWHQQKMSDAETNRYREILRKYEQDRSLLIKPFMKCGEYERAASLAEKYCDFATLVELCEQFDNQERLQRYMDQFQQNGFSDFVFKWYLEAGKRGKLMTSNLSAHPLLAKFLESTENQYMSWLHDIHCNDYHQAHKTLLALAQQEQQFASKKKTLLSLSKLTALAADEKTDDLLSNLEVISDEQNLLMHQEQLPPELIQKLGMDLNLMRVLSVKELIQMYISDYNVCASEYDFKKALDLLLYTDKDDPDRHTMTEEIWCQAILKDNWQRSPSGTNPVDSCRDTVFYHTLELLMAEDSAQMKELFPNADRILSCELLGDIRHQDEFKYLIRATIEYISRQCQHQ
jgi:nuclear pore complex protein Nup133